MFTLMVRSWRYLYYLHNEINYMPLPSRHRIRNSIPGGLGPSTLSLGQDAPHNIESLRVRGKNLCFFETKIPERGSSPISETWGAHMWRFAKLMSIHCFQP